MLLRFRHKGGVWRDCDVSVRMVTGPDGAPRVVATTRDVTEARRTEEQISTLNRVLSHHAAQLEIAPHPVIAPAVVNNARTTVLTYNRDQTTPLVPVQMGNERQRRA